MNLRYALYQILQSIDSVKAQTSPLTQPAAYCDTMEDCSNFLLQCLFSKNAASAIFHIEVKIAYIFSYLQAVLYNGQKSFKIRTMLSGTIWIFPLLTFKKCLNRQWIPSPWPYPWPALLSITVRFICGWLFAWNKAVLITACQQGLFFALCLLLDNYDNSVGLDTLIQCSNLLS